MNLPCPQHPDCTTDPNAVLANLSSEAPDKQVCIQLVSGVLGPARKLLGPGKAIGDSPCLTVCEIEQGTDAFDCAFNAYVCALDKNIICGANLGDDPTGDLPSGAGDIPPSGGASGGPGPSTGTPPKPVPPPSPTPKPPGGGSNPPTGTTPGGTARIFGNNEVSCTSHCPDGTEFTWVVASGFFLAGSQRQADAIAQSYACLKASQKKVCITGNTPDACSLAAYTGNILVSGTNPPYTLQVTSGQLPPGLSLTQDPANEFNFLISGTPASGGTFTFTVTATDPNQNFLSKTFSIHIFEITTPGPSLPDSTFGAAYSTTLAESGAALPFWTVVKGQLPTGLSLNPNSGTISGTNYDLVDQTFTVRMEDLISGISCQKEYTIHCIKPPLNWSNLVWSAPSITTGFGGSTSYSAVGAHLSAAAVQPGPPHFGDPALQSGVVGGGSFNYTGASQLSRLQVSWQASGGATGTGQIQIFENALLKATFDIGAGSGTFTIDTLVGGLISVTFFVSAQAGFGQSGLATVDAYFQPNY